MAINKFQAQGYRTHVKNPLNILFSGTKGHWPCLLDCLGHLTKMAATTIYG